VGDLDIRHAVRGVSDHQSDHETQNHKGN
jgi:hypothetical protein